MSTVVLLDAGPLGLVTNPKRSAVSTGCAVWLQSLVNAGWRVVVPEIADYEVRRELLRANKTAGIAQLDALAALLEYLPLTTAAMRHAADEQRNALLELFRVLGSGRSGVVVYQHRNGLLNRCVMGPPRLLKKLKDGAKRLRSGATASAKPSSPPGQSRHQHRKPYSHFHARKWFTSQQWEFALEFRVWRSVSVPAMRIWIRPMLCGHFILRMLYRLEELFPHFFAGIGEYPTLVIRRSA